MNYKMIGYILSQIVFVELLFMIPALIIGIHDFNQDAVFGFVVTLGIMLVFALTMYLICRKAEKKFYAREGLVCVGIGWIVMSFFGALPFYISKEIPSFIDAMFEIVSGFTTTGASILTDVEAMSRGLLYWRSFSHWLGGMGVLVFVLAIAPRSNKESGFTMHILRAESPGPNVGKLVPRMKKTALILYMIYMALTFINFIFLILGGMPAFESVCTALGTAGTGGFGVKNDSIASYSPYIQNVCTIFMLLFGINFSCYYLLLLRHIKSVLFDEELIMYVLIVIGSIIAISINVWGMYDSVEETIRTVAFQVASIITTTGFATTDFDLWPGFSKALILVLMFIGACAGSTGGGFKCGRALLIFKNIKRNIRKMLNPQKIEIVKNNGQMISEKVLNNTDIYLAVYVLIIVFSFLLVSIDGFSIETNISAVVSCVNNIGPGFDKVGPTCNFHDFSIFSKIVFIVDMLAGRLELFPMIVLFSRNTWKVR